MRPNVRDALLRLLRSAEEPPGSDYATERGFARLLGLPKSKELDYADAVFRRIGARGFMLQLLRLILVLPLLPIAVPLFVLSRDPVARESRLCLRDPRHLPKVNRLWELTRLPPRIRLALASSSFATVHSEEMTRAMLDLAHARRLETLTVIVGLAHADEIAHYLKHLHPRTTEL